MSSSGKLDLDPGVIASCRAAAAQIAGQVAEEIDGKTTVSVERTVARLLGVDGANELDAPLPNVLVDHVRDHGELGRGIAYWLGNALLHEGSPDSAQRIAEAVDAGELDLCALPRAEDGAIRERIARECEARLYEISERMTERRALRERLGESPPPLRYVLTATGNVYEDVVHGLAVAQAGGDIVAVIRSTAQSLLDYVPYGPTTEGYGGTFATQANFQIMRAALDEWSASQRPLRAPVELLLGPVHARDRGDGRDRGLRQHGQRRAVRDPLPRHQPRARPDRPARLAHDQRLLRRRHQHRRGQLPAHGRRDRGGAVGDRLAVHQPPAGARLGRARRADRARRRVRDRHARRQRPAVASGRRRSSRASCSPTARSSTCRPTRHMDGNLYRTHAADSLFNLVTIATGQGIQTIGVPTEGIFTPHVHDRVIGLENVNYVFNAARDLGEEIEFKRGGIIQTRAQEVLAGAHALLERIAEQGLFAALGEGVFGDVPRQLDEGRGIEGIVETDEGYFNPVTELMRGTSSLA